MILLKLGGSVITDKSVPFSIRREVILRLAGEIKEAGKQLIVVHGGGSFGHPLASEYMIHEGLKGPEQLIGVAKTSFSMEDLNRRIVEIFISVGLPAVPIQTSAVFKCENKRIQDASLDIIKDFLEIGTLPILYGDVVIDKALKVCILSGDQLVSFLARHLRPERVILATDVDGVLDKDGRVVPSITPEKAGPLLDSISTIEGDVTGGMKGKVEELLDLSRAGVPSLVVNALVEGRVKNALLGKKTIGTLFEAEDDKGSKA